MLKTEFALMWLALAVSTFACTPERAPRTAIAPRAATAFSTASEPNTATEPEELRQFAVEIAEYQRALDVFQRAVMHPQPAPEHFSAKALERELKGRFDQLRFARARGYLYWHDSGPFRSFNEPGCHFGVLTHDGVPCSSALVPPVELSEQAAHELLSAVSNEALPTVPKVCMCGGKASVMHSFVFYAEDETPIATITLNLSYHDLKTAPEDGHAKFGLSYTSEAFRQWYAGFCKAAGMPLCVYWDRERKDAFLNVVNTHQIRAPERSPLELVADRPLNELDAQSRRVLCAIAHDHNERRPSRGPDDTYGRESESGEVWTGRAIAWPECERQFPTCKQTLSVVWPCEQAALAGDPGFFEPEVAHCKAYADCIWGFVDQWGGMRPLP